MEKQYVLLTLRTRIWKHEAFSSSHLGTADSPEVQGLQVSEPQTLYFNTTSSISISTNLLFFQVHCVVAVHLIEKKNSFQFNLDEYYISFDKRQWADGNRPIPSWNAGTSALWLTVPKDSSFHLGVSSPQQPRQNQKDHSTESAESLTTLTQWTFMFICYWNLSQFMQMLF